MPCPTTVHSAVPSATPTTLVPASPAPIISQLVATKTKLKLEVLIISAIKEDPQSYKSWRCSTFRKIAINHSTAAAVDMQARTLKNTVSDHAKRTIIHDALEEAIKPTKIST